MNAEHDPGPPGSLPPSAKYVRYVLRLTDEKQTQADLIEETGLPSRTVRYALERLDEEDVLESKHNIHDARQRLYWLDE